MARSAPRSGRAKASDPSILQPTPGQGFSKNLGQGAGKRLGGSPRLRSAVRFAAGDGRYAEGLDSDILQFLLRPWRWPDTADLKWFALLGAVSGVIGYSLSQAYRSAAAATIAPFEYTALPLAIFWGWAVFADWPDGRGFLGAALIAGAGIYVFWREGRTPRPPARRPLRRW